RTRALAGATAGALAVAILGLGGVLPAASEGLSSSGPVVKSLPKPLVSAQASYVSRQHHRQQAAPLPPPTKSSCRSVVYIGDSTSEGETSTDYIPNPRLRLPAQLAKFGVTTTYPEISGARSIIETFQGYPNAPTVAQQHLSSGYKGCWILALGTNDVDN